MENELISVHRRGIGEKDIVAVYDISGCIKCWGRRGILSGGLLGFVVGAIFVSNPPAADVLTFGAIGTLIVCAIEGAVVGGGLGALLAAFNGRGVLRGNATGLARTLTTGPPAYQPMLPATSDHGDPMDSLWQDTQTRPEDDPSLAGRGRRIRTRGRDGLGDESLRGVRNE